MDLLIKYYRVINDFDAVRAWAVALGNNAQYIDTPDDKLVAVHLALGQQETWTRFEAEFGDSIEEVQQ